MQPWEQYQQPQAIAKQPWEQFGSSEQSPQSDQGGFFSDIGKNVGNRWSQAQEDVHNYPALSPVIGLGVATGTANDIAGATTNAVIPDFVKRGFSVGTQSTSDAIDKTNIGQSLGDALLSAKNSYESFMGNNPKSAIALRAAGNVASFVPTARAVESAVSATPAITSSIKNNVVPVINKFESASGSMPGIAGDISSGSQLPTPITADMIRRASTNAYNAVEDSGTTFNPTVTGKALDVIESAKQKPLFGGKVLTKEQADINSALDDYAAARGQPMSMDDLQGLDSTLGDKAAQAYVAGNYNKGRILSDVQDNIRGLVKKTSPIDVVSGSPDGANILLNDAVPLWSTQAKMQDLEKIIDNANNTPNPATAIRTGFAAYMRNAKKFNQLPENVQQLVAKAAKSGAVDDLLGVVGSRLNQIAGGAMGGPQGYVASTAMAMTGRGVRTALKNRQANTIFNSMVENIRPSVEKFADYVPSSASVATNNAPIAAQQMTLRQIMNLPPAQAKIALKALKTKPKP